MSDTANDDRHFFVSYGLPYVYVFWKQAEPAPFEIAAVHRIAPP
ncbi:MAG: hypothetical protein JWN51_1857 [Phycisphaerales bacterium]|nr:hypothetical protein [Phycisphaerales bacterium]